MEISESLLQFIWKNLLFKQSDLLSFHGDRICVVSPGEVNDNAGPDFSNAHITSKNMEKLNIRQVPCFGLDICTDTCK